MNNLLQIIYKYTARETRRIQKICDPLNNYFGITDFWYAKTDADGNFFIIGNKPELHENYFGSKGYLNNPLYRNSSLIRSGIYDYREIKNNNHQEVMKNLSDKIGTSLGFSIVHRKGNTIERFGYAGKSGTDFSSCLMSNLSLLDQFNIYFTKEISPLIKNIEDDLVSLPTLLGPSYNQAIPSNRKTLNRDETIEFLDKIKFLKKKETDLLTDRELDCLECLLLGFSAKQSGSKLYISPRTVETHLEAIKRKLNCSTKKELHNYAYLLNTSNFFKK